MPDVIERAHQAFIAALRENGDRKRALGAALQAALDPSDEALVDALATAITNAPFSAPRSREQARRGILALRSACAVPNEAPPSGDTK